MTTTDVRAADPAADRRLIVGMAFGGMAAQTLRAAVRLRVPELIGETPRRAADIAAEAGTEPQTMTRLLRALAALGVLVQDASGSFSATPAGALLDPRHPHSLASFVRVFTDPVALRAWEHLDDSVRTGEIAFDAVFGTDFFRHLAQHPELSQAFNSAMSQAAGAAAGALPHAYDFGRFGSVTDVGGGAGTVLAGVLDAHPRLTGVVYDTAEGLAQAPTTLDRHRLGDRCTLRAGDFFRSVPEGSDLYLIKSVLHDWSDDQAVTILRHCREVLPAGGRVLVVEPVLPDIVGPVRPETAATDAEGHAADGGITYLSDLNMLVNVGGRERTRKDFDAVCHRAGLRVLSVAPLTGAAPYCLVEAAAQ
ncbi:methyltransferase [Streptomyces sp. NBC_00083]|uniref:methyltransferase n=1 Tax=Streptomyces sp. NBC_00083 TaxID=2975647 RepID=UPI002257FFEA|nr:methyltransferase [Streptomyces sp. NBC_00083]MCX5384363.1 acetylserotonin O-methyltransferase [Streptomyces sp. NBC_00083]